MMKKYDLLYIRKMVDISIIIFLPIMTLFVFVSLSADVLANDLLLSILLPVGCVLAVLCFVLFQVMIERIILKRQILAYHVDFCDHNARQIAARSLIFLCDEWIIWSGRMVLHKDYILSISIKPENKYNSMGGYYCLCKCRDHKQYRIFVPSTTEAKEIKHWHKNAGATA